MAMAAVRISAEWFFKEIMQNYRQVMKSAEEAVGVGKIVWHSGKATKDRREKDE